MFAKRLATITGAVMILALAPAAVAQDFAINWYTIDGGGGTSTGGAFALSGTIGQPDAGALTGGDFALVGGFWGGATGAPCFGDLDGDNQAALSDLAILLSNFGTPAGALPEDGDLDGNGSVDLSDLALMLSVFGTVCG